MDDLLQEFLTETSESLDVVDLELVRFEQEPNNEKILDNIFRLVHTIKGTCGFLGLPRLEALAHAGETLMGKYRDGKPVTEDGVSFILQSIDRLKEILVGLEESDGTEPEGSDDDLIDSLNAISMADEIAAAAAAAAAPKPDKTDDDASAEVEDDPLVVQELERDLRPGEVSLDELERAFMETEVEETPVVEEVVKPVAAKKEPSEKAEGTAKPVSQQSLRVNVDTLENLMTMVSELVLTRNQLLEIARRHEESEFKVPLQRLSNVTGELQEGVMKTRMQPIGNAWQKLPRIVRDLANELEKDIDLRMVGAETELDRQVLDMIKDPLTHMVRNSADHGLETPDERRKSGKPEKGVIELSAYHEGGHIIIDIVDDGRGLNLERIKEKVISNGLATESEIASMPESQIQKYIFNAGLSTAQEVTSVSGRGVGMDVVRNNIETIGGTIDVKSITGKGSTFTIKIPLTLAIVSALIVEVAGDRYAIPQLSVVELVQAESNSEHHIERIKETPVLRLRNKLLPLVQMGRLLGISSEGDEVNDKEISDESGFIVVMQVGSQSFGVVVDGVFHTEEIVVKPMSTVLRNVNMFSGNTILGDGSVIMIVDPNGVAEGVSTSAADEANRKSEQEQIVTSNENQTTSMLLFRAGSNTPKAVPLSLVTRLEEVNVSEIENSNGRDLVQYRGTLMPLVYVDDEMQRREDGSQPMLVFSDAGRSMGLVVDEIVDIVEDQLDIEVTSENVGVVGSAVIKGKATEILDIGHYLPLAFEDWFTHSDTSDDKRVRKLLFVEESEFFRNMLTPIMQAAGYRVTTASSVHVAKEILNEAHVFDVVVADVEMRGSNGFDLAKIIHDKPSYGCPALLAISSVCTPSLVERCRESQFDDFVAKFDRPGLIASLKELSNELELAA
ncbi:MAG: hybrid sensor histidine kinase/response regulator [Hyphomicrobiales bacterium]